MSKGDVAERTRQIYQLQHNKYLEDEVLFQRFLKMVSDPAYFHLTRDDFRGKRILDAGCGNTAYFPLAMANMGVEHTTCLDLGKEWIEPLSTALDKFGVKQDAYSCISGSTCSIPFADNAFDMVFSNGVLMHLADMEEIRTAWAELSRVTKPGGYLYVILSCPRGLMEEEIAPALRRFYQNNEAFKELIDNLTPEDFATLFADIARIMKERTGEESALTSAVVRELFDVDLCTFLQNLLQVPKRHILELDEEFAEKMYAEYGFEAPLRCKRYVVRKNVRKYFAPLHYESNDLIPSLLYGPGNLEYIARKR